MPTFLASTLESVSRQSNPRAAPQAQARSEPQSSGLRGWPLLTRPMMPLVRPAPLSAWMLLGVIVAYPHPAAMSCAVEDGPAAAPPKAPGRAGGAGAPAGLGRPPPPKPPNIISTGTWPLALAGVTSVIWISTLMAG